MTPEQIIKVRLLCTLRYQGNGTEFIRGDKFMSPHETGIMTDDNYHEFWNAVYDLRDNGLLHIRFEPHANTLALTQDGDNFGVMIKDILKII